MERSGRDVAGALGGSRGTAQPAAAAAQRRLAPLLDQDAHAVWFLTPDGVVTAVNDCSLRRTGVPRDEVVGRPLWEVPWFPRGTRDRIRDLVAQATSGRRPSEEELEYVLADGRLRYVLLSLTPTTDERGTVTLLVAVGHDVTAAWRARRMAAVVENSPDIVLWGDLDCEAVFVSQGGAELLGVRAGVTEGSLFIDQLDRRLAATLIREALPSVYDRGSWHGALRVRHAGTGEQVDLEARLFRVRGVENGAGVVAGVARDVTERKRIEAQLAEARADAERARQVPAGLDPRLEHELRNQIQQILGFGELLSMEELPPEHVESVEIIVRAARRLSVLLDGDA